MTPSAELRVPAPGKIDHDWVTASSCGMETLHPRFPVADVAQNVMRVDIVVGDVVENVAHRAHPSGTRGVPRLYRAVQPMTADFGR